MTRVKAFTGEKQNASLPFEGHLKHVLFCMKMFGIYYDKQFRHEIETSLNDTNVNSLTDQNKCFQNCWIRKVVNGRTYSFIILVVLAISGIKYVPSFWLGQPFQNGIVLEVITIAFIVQCFVNRLVFLISFGKDNRFMELKNRFNNRITTHYEGSARFQKRIKMSITIFTCMAWIVFPVEIMGSFLMIISNVFLAYLEAVIRPFPDSIPTRTIACVITLHALATWSLTTCYIMCVSCIFYYEFDEVNHALEKTLKEEGTTAVTHLEKYRVCHENLCEILGLADVDFKYLVANCYATNLFMSCFVIYNLVRDPDTTFFFLLLEISWIVFNLLSVLLVSWVAALVNESAHSPLDNIYKIDVSEATPQQLGQLNLFLSRLTGTSIGFTFVGMFTVTKEVILTLTGLFVTYLFLLLQFKI